MAETRLPVFLIKRSCLMSPHGGVVYGADSPLRVHGCGGRAGGCSGREGTLRLLGVQARRWDERFCRLCMQASMIVQDGRAQPGITCWNDRETAQFRTRIVLKTSTKYWHAASKRLAGAVSAVGSWENHPETPESNICAREMRKIWKNSEVV